MRRYSLEEGTALVKGARHGIELHLRSANFDRSIIERRTGHLNEHSGVLVTIRHYPLGEMRGAAGVMRSDEPTGSLVVDAAIAAATQDRRFVPISSHELDQITIDVSVISRPERLEGGIAKIKRGIKAGRDGVMVEYGFKTGTVLPDPNTKKVEKMLAEACENAGLRAEDWKRGDLRIYKFSAQIFDEAEPNGTVEELQLK
ncbi:MAG: TIGR00296 family protein [Candidatus Micrarchaeota archaeon]|nr:TIGR00296 family protein [Candidatus Micrarchaeota archaeon]MDE1848119.1 TIGR00296 family protein [Candidatus Micrarchaeota archaeon]MDE1863926.1 TIGR00296 family protein [Candidatus Micrarchaeota archaeon]